MNIFKNALHMTPAAQKLDRLMAEQDSYWSAYDTEYGHKDQEIPGKSHVVDFLPPGIVQIEAVKNEVAAIEISDIRDVA